MNVETIPVSFAGVSTNKESASVGLKIDREDADLEVMDSMFCGHRLTAELQFGDGSRQLPGMEDLPEPVKAVWDAKSFSTRQNEFGTRLTTSKDVDMALLSKYAGKKGRLVIRDVEDIPDEKKAITPDEDLNEAAARVTPLGRGHEDPISALGLSPAMTGKLEAAGLKTVGKLINRIAADDWWHRDIPGVGKVGVDKITDALTAWHAAQPDEEDEDDSVLDDEQE